MSSQGIQGFRTRAQKEWDDNGESGNNVFVARVIGTVIAVLGFCFMGWQFMFTKPATMLPPLPLAAHLNLENGCFYSRGYRGMQTKRTEYPCIAKDALASFKAGKPSAEVSQTLARVDADYQRQNEAFQAARAAAKAKAGN
jgi:hypothetical protein